LTVLTVADCPNAPVIEERVHRALDGRSAEVELIEVADEESAAQLGMTGSPTVLIEGAPSMADLRRALGASDATKAESARLPVQPTAAVGAA
jgi:hypothetical protein